MTGLLAGFAVFLQLPVRSLVCKKDFRRESRADRRAFSIGDLRFQDVEWGMQSTKLTLLCRVPTIIERDALAKALADQGVICDRPERAMIQNLTDQTNLSFGGYSALFEGYSILVREDQKEKAEEIRQNFLNKHRLQLADEETLGQEPDDFVNGLDRAGRRFFQCTFWSISLPVVMNVCALYWFLRSRTRWKDRPVFVGLALLLNFCTLLVGLFLIQSLWR